MACGGIEARAGMYVLVRAQPGARAAVTRTFVSVTSPVLVTLIVKLAVPPLTTCCESGVFATVIAGWMTVTSAVSVAVTSGPTGGVPGAVGELVKLAATFASVQS